MMITEEERAKLKVGDVVWRTDRFTKSITRLIVDDFHDCFFTALSADKEMFSIGSRTSNVFIKELDAKEWLKQLESLENVN